MASVKSSVKSALESVGLGAVARSVYDRLAPLRKALWARRIRRKHQATDRVEVRVRDVSWLVATEDTYSKWWLLERLEGTNVHEEGISLRILDALEGARCFADVGTNLGWYTCLASRALPEGQVHGFEMDDLNLALLRRNIEINGFQNTTVHHAAVTDEPGTVSYRRAFGLPSAGFQIGAGTPGTETGEMVSVPAIRLDDFYRDEALLPDVMKIDVEGAEMSVLRGMTDLIERARPTLFIEVHPEEIKSFDSSSEEVVGFLLDHGYRVFDIEDKGGQSGGATREIEVEREHAPTECTMLLARHQAAAQ